MAGGSSAAAAEVGSHGRWTVALGAQDMTFLLVGGRLRSDPIMPSEGSTCSVPSTGRRPGASARSGPLP
jgi:hypothetical protein